MIVKVNATAAEQKNLDLLNKIFKDVPLSQEEVNSIAWLAGWETSKIENIMNAFIKHIYVRDGILFPLRHDSQEGFEKQYVKEVFL